MPDSPATPHHLDQIVIAPADPDDVDRSLAWPRQRESFKVILEVEHIGKGYDDDPAIEVIAMQEHDPEAYARLDGPISEIGSLNDLLADEDLILASGRFTATLTYWVTSTSSRSFWDDYDVEYGYALSDLQYIGPAHV